MAGGDRSVAAEQEATSARRRNISGAELPDILKRASAETERPAAQALDQPQFPAPPQFQPLALSCRSSLGESGSPVMRRSTSAITDGAMLPAAN